MALRTLSMLGLLSAATTACTGESEDTGEEDVPVDADEDGFDSSLDCDDADASIYPGAEETWYDGIDSDCAGDDDYDADGDGVAAEAFGGADCDDTNPEVMPGSPEIWYDGIDSDCRGNDDFDQDADGFRSSSETEDGQDCDDEDTSIYPGAPDAWYDGIDSNCDGASDYDADGDGYDSRTDGIGEDCNDEDAEINPSATEVWYDGIDADCAGDDDYDADGDGYIADSEGGDDCNDTEPESFPGTLEQIDGIDTNCDGITDFFGIEEDYGGSYIVGSGIGDWFGTALAVGDLDADGRADMVVIQESDDGQSIGGYGLVSVGLGSSSSSTPSVATTMDFSVLSTLDSGVLDAVDVVEDMDLDGADDLLIGAAAYQGNLGGAWLLTGSDIASSAQVDLDDASWFFTGTGGGFGSRARDVGDLDGDGLAEVLVSAPDDAGMVYLFSSASMTASASLDANDADAIWSGSTSLDGLGTDLVALNDVDGDGLSDVAISAPGSASASGRVYIVSGSVAPNSGQIDEVAAISLEGSDAGGEAGTAMASGDVDGDGTLDLMVGAPMAVTQSGRVHVVSGTSLVAGSWEMSDVSFVSYTGPTIFGQSGSAIASNGDVNGDGLDDILVGAMADPTMGTDSGAVWLILSGMSGQRALADADASFWGGSASDQTGVSVGMADMNGDGLEDLLIGVPGEDTFGNEGAVYIGYSGF